MTLPDTIAPRIGKLFAAHNEADDRNDHNSQSQMISTSAAARSLMAASIYEVPETAQGALVQLALIADDNDTVHSVVANAEDYEAVDRCLRIEAAVAALTKFVERQFQIKREDIDVEFFISRHTDTPAQIALAA